MQLLSAQNAWIVPMPGTTKLSRIEENIASTDIVLSPSDLSNINTALSKIKVTGDRYPEAFEKRTGL